MTTLTLLSLALVLLLAWGRAGSSRRPVDRGAAPASTTARRPAPRPNPSPPPEPTRATIHVVFVAAAGDGLLLDCVLAERFGVIPAGQAFTLAVRTPAPIGAALADVFAAWADGGVPIELQVEVDLHGPRARFTAGETRAMLDIVASSPLRGAGSS